MGNEQTQIATARQQLWEVAGFDGYFATKTGGEVSAETTKVHDGGSLTPETLAGPSETSNIVLTKPYRSGMHRATLKALSAGVGRYRTTVSGYDTDPDLGPIGDPITYANALLVKLTWPEGDAGGNAASMFTLEFAVDAGA